MRYSANKLRGNLYRVLDDVLKTGKPVEVDRCGKVLTIISADRKDRLSRLKPHPGYLTVEPEAIVHMDWSKEWRP